MFRLAGRQALLLVLVASGRCTRGCQQASPLKDAAPEAAGESGASDSRVTPAPALLSPAVFSAPIAAVRVNRELVVAGLVAAEGVVRVMGLRDGRTAWMVDA